MFERKGGREKISKTLVAISKRTAIFTMVHTQEIVSKVGNN